MRTGATTARAVRHSAGFSLVELLLAMLVLLAIMGGVLSAVVDTSSRFKSETSQREMKNSARVAIDELERSIQQVGFGVERGDPLNPGAWQKDLVYAGSHTLIFNADLDPALGALDESQSISFPTGGSYDGEGTTATANGAESYVYTMDANDDGALSLADRAEAESGSYNPATLTPNPLDFALFLRAYGHDGLAHALRVTPLVPYLYTNVVDTVDYPDGSVPDPLFTYLLTEDTDGDGVLDDAECTNDAIDACPPATPRGPLHYIWGDSDFDGTLSDAEKDALISTPVGAIGWSGNPWLLAGDYPSTTLSGSVNPAGPSPDVLEVASAAGFAAGVYVRIGSGSAAEEFVVDYVDTAASPPLLYLISDPLNTHSIGETVTLLPSTLLRSVASVQIHITAITPRPDRSAAGARLGQAFRETTRGLPYRTLQLRRTVDLVNLRAAAMQ